MLAAFPVAGLLAGGLIGWWRGGDEGAGSDPAPATVELDAAALEVAAPARPLPDGPRPAVIDPAEVVGLPTPAVAVVPAGAAVELVAGEDGAPRAIDRATGEEVAPTPAPPLPPVEPLDATALGDPAAPEPTLPLPGEPTTTEVDGDPDFVDPCTLDVEGCQGAPGALRADPGTSSPTLAPLLLGYPFPAAGVFADACAEIEGASVPDPQLAPGVRPTVAVLVNQPASIALSGTWIDGTSLEKLTMLTSPDDDQRWREEWEAGDQRQVLACLTLPLDVVRAHASGGRADLRLDLVAISAEGRTTMAGSLTLTVPLDGVDQPFADGLTVTGLGERPRADGTMAPVAQLHYAVDPAQAIPAGGQLDRATATVHAMHAFVENADCAGWAVNQQGQDRTLDGTVAVRTEARRVDGRSRPVTVVDADLFLDTAVRGGWEGYVCVRVFARDRFGNEVTVALRGAAVRAPRTATYDIGLGIAAGVLPEGWSIEANWSPAGRTVWCGPATLVLDSDSDAGGGASSAYCTTLARLVPDGATVTLTPVDADGERQRPLAVTVPGNTGYCNPDDPYGALSDGCDTGFVQLVELPLDESSALLQLTVLRTAAPGQVVTNPSHAWRIDPVQAFRY